MSGLELPAVTWQAILVGAGVVAAGWVIGRLVRWAMHKVLRRRGRSASASQTFGAVGQTVVALLAAAAALTIVFPSVKPVNALGGLGVLSIAAGIAFQTVLGNMFAGLVILARDIYRVGDQIAVGEVAGTVSEITLTSTVVRTFDDRTDLALAVRTAESAMRGVPVVLDDPSPQALVQAVGSSTVRMDLRFWSGARQMETRVAQHEVIVAVLQALTEAGVVTGSDVLVIEGGPRLLDTLHDRSETSPAATPDPNARRAVQS